MTTPNADSKKEAFMKEILRLRGKRPDDDLEQAYKQFIDILDEYALDNNENLTWFNQRNAYSRDISKSLYFILHPDKMYVNENLEWLRRKIKDDELNDFATDKRSINDIFNQILQKLGRFNADEELRNKAIEQLNKGDRTSSKRYLQFNDDDNHTHAPEFIKYIKTPIGEYKDKKRAIKNDEDAELSPANSNNNSNDEIEQIKNDIKALKRIKNDATTDDATREITKSTIKELKEKKKAIKHGKRRNPPKSISRDVELIVKNDTEKFEDLYEPDSENLLQENIENEVLKKRLIEQRRKRIVDAAFKRIRNEFKAQRDIAKQNAENEVLQNKQMKSNSPSSTQLERIKRLFDVDDDEDAEIIIKTINKKKALQKELKALTNDPSADLAQIQALKDKIKSIERIIYKIGNKTNGINEKEQVENRALKQSVFKALQDNVNTEAKLEQKAEQAKQDKINKLTKSIFNAWREEANKDVIDLRKNPPTPEQRYPKDEAEKEFYKQQFKEQAEQAVKEYNDIITERMNKLLQHFNDIVNSDLSNEEKHEEKLKASDEIEKLYEEMKDTEKMAKQELKLLHERLPIMSHEITRLYNDIQREELFKPFATYIHLTNEYHRIFEPLDRILKEAADKAREELWEKLENSNNNDDIDLINSSPDSVRLQARRDEPDKLAIEQQTEKEEIKPQTGSKTSDNRESNSTSSKQSPKRRGKHRNPPKIDIDVSVPNEIKTTYDARRKIATIKPVFKAKLTF